MDSNLFHFDWDRAWEVVATVAVLAVLLERALWVLVEHRAFIAAFVFLNETPSAFRRPSRAMVVTSDGSGFEVRTTRGPSPCAELRLYVYSWMAVPLSDIGDLQLEAVQN